MRGIFLSAAILISAPVFADQAREFSAFLEKYKVFADDRAQKSKSHSARFGSKLTFRECDSSTMFYSDAVTCDCPTGNTYLQCLTSAQAIVKIDPNDVGGRGYFLITSEGSALDVSGKWVPAATRGTYTTVIDRLGTEHAITIPVPNRATIDSVCAGGSGDRYSFTIAYGAVMPMDIEFANRMKVRSESLGQSFDMQGFIFSRARTNGSRSKKGGTAGSFTCRPDTTQY